MQCRATFVLTVLLAVAVAGCGGDDPAARPVAATSASASAGPASHPLLRGTATIPTRFPLTLGLERATDSRETGPGDDVPGTYLEDLCGSTAWPGPGSQRVDRLAVQISAPHSQVTRELVLFDTTADARNVVRSVATDVKTCQSAEGQPVTRFHPHTGHPSVTYAQAPNDGSGLTLVQVVRLGRAVVATREYAEPHDVDAAAAVIDLTGGLAPVTARMACIWKRSECDRIADTTITVSGTARL